MPLLTTHDISEEVDVIVEVLVVLDVKGVEVELVVVVSKEDVEHSVVVEVLEVVGVDVLVPVEAFDDVDDGVAVEFAVEDS